jgi:histidinol-phosphate aminotransferase
MNVLDLARPEIRALEPYSSARMESTGGSVFLDANESAYPPFDGAGGWNRYPEPQPPALIQRLAGLYGVTPDHVLAGRGSDEGIDLLVRAFCRAGEDAILISPPTFGMYAVCARVQGADVVEAPLGTDLALDVDAVLAAWKPAVKLVFVCAPNNPSGSGAARAQILHLASALAGRAVVVADQAYVEFATAPGVADAVATVENLVVLRTLSKAWALAGVRLGVLLAAPRVVALLRKIMPPYPLPRPTTEAVLHALAPEQQIHTSVRIGEVIRERERMRAALSGLACVGAVLPSEANFLTVRFVDAGQAFAALRAAGVVVRDVRRYPRLEDALRITIGTPEENRRVLDALARPRDPSAETGTRMGVMA